MTLRSRLATGSMASAAILLVPLLLAVQSLTRLQKTASALKDRELAASLLLGQLREGMTDLRSLETAVLFVKRPEDRDAMAAKLSEVARIVDTLQRHQLVDAARDIRAAVQQIAQWAPAEFEAVVTQKNDDADSISARYIVPALARADSSVRAGEADLRSRTHSAVEQTAAGIKTTRAAAIAGMILALVIAAGVGFWFTRSISGPVIGLERGMRAVADGDLSYRVNLDADRADEFGRLAKSFDEMTRHLAELDKLKAEFVSVASHELKTPVNVIIGYLQLLDEGIYGPLTPKQLEVHRTIEVQAKSLLRLTKQLLDVSRFEAGGGRLDIRRVELHHLLDELQDAFHVLALQREITFIVERREGLPEEVFWDLDRVNEVLGNLVSNAFKFTERGGRVELSVEAVDGSIVMEVRDTGAGIPPEQLHRIFEKFYQADNQQSARAKGSGLGLAIAKQIVEAHGGQISCESTPGVGTTFTIVLPKHVKARRTSAHQAIPTGV
jgi:signal transduction histidine kinase